MPLTNSSSPQPITSSTATSTQVSVSNPLTYYLLLTANPARKGATVLNGQNTTILLEFESQPGGGAVPTATTPFAVEISAGSYYEIPFGYVGAITAWTLTGASSGVVSAREFS